MEATTSSLDPILNQPPKDLEAVDPEVTQIERKGCTVPYTLYMYIS